MALTSLQRKKLTSDCNKININTLMTYIQSGDISLEDLPNLSDERRREIEKRLNEMPNPIEQKEWADIRILLDRQEYSQSLLDMISSYIRRWEGSRPSGNHVDEANQCYFLVERKLQEITTGIEQADWEAVNVFSIDSLLAHLAKYPSTSHKDEIDEAVWGLTDKNQVVDIQKYLEVFPSGKFVGEADDAIWGVADKNQVADIQRYLDIFPNGKFAADARAMLNGIVDWENVKNTGDIFMVNDYIRNHPDSPFIPQARIELMKQKQSEISMMRDEPNKYEDTRLLKLIDEKIVSRDELIRAGVMTENVWDTLTGGDYDLPDINEAITSSVPECKDGFTDVYFFGIPSTGKTCVLMGLSRSSSLNINLAHGGGDYAAALQQYTDVGKTVPRTPGTFVTTLEATISSSTTTMQNAWTPQWTWPSECPWPWMPPSIRRTRVMLPSWLPSTRRSRRRHR